MSMLNTKFIFSKIRTAKRYFSLILFLPFIFFIIILIKILRPYILIRWSRLDNARIGHFAANNEIYLLEKKFGIDVPNEKYIDFFYMPEPKICNKQLCKMWKQKLNIVPWFMVFPLEYLRLKKILFNDENTFSTDSKDKHNLLDKTKPNLSLNIKEKKRGFDFLKKIGLPENAKFVCLQVRDNTFLDEKRYNYHEYRNCDVENFRSACNFLADQNIYVFRMGSKVSRKISYASKKIIDYATNGMRTDFLDIFLGSECLFWITTGSGIDNLSKLFRKPVLYTNQVPIGHISTFQKTSLIIFKHFFDKHSKNKLNLENLIKKNLCFSLRKDDFDKNDVIIRENNLEEIENVTKEMYLRVKDSFWDTWDETKEIQKIFWNKFPYQKKFHGEIVSNIGKEYLINNKNFYN